MSIKFTIFIVGVSRWQKLRIPYICRARERETLTRVCRYSLRAIISHGCRRVNADQGNCRSFPWTEGGRGFI